MAAETLGSAYTIVRRLAVGGMGEVLLAECQADPRIGLGAGFVVVKRTIPSHPNRAHQDRMLKEEGRLGLRLRHENLVETFALDEVDGAPVLVMEYLAGRSMAQVLGAAKRSKQMVPVDVALAILRAAACGLHFAHTLRDGDRQLGLVHRDVSPANIFVTFDGRVKVIDFGVAKADDSEIKTSTGVLKGKIGYMAPEHTRGEQLDPRADLWSLGVFLWETLVAERLFSTQNPAQALHRINHAAIPAPSTLRSDVPRDVDALVLALLARQKDARVQSGAELVRRIDAIANVASRAPDIARFMVGRFPDDAERGREEAQRAARVRAEPLPAGLVESGAMAEDDLNAATVVANRRDLIRMARLSAGRPLDDDDGKTVRSSLSLSSDAMDSLEGQTVQTTPERPFDSEMSTDGLGRRPASSASASSTSAPAASATRVDDITPRVDHASPPVARADPVDPAARPASGTLRRPRARVGPMAAALLTCGVLASGMGAAFTAVSLERESEPLFVAVLQDESREVVMALVDAPRDAASRRVTVDDLRFRAGGTRVVSLSPEAFADGLERSGVRARGTLPPTPRARVAALLPPAILALGVLALGIALPALVVSGVLLFVLRLVVTAAIAAAVFVGATDGALTWPGTKTLFAPAASFDPSSAAPDTPAPR